MSHNLTATIPHRLTRVEARRKMEEGIARARREYGSFLSGLTERWEGDILHFSLKAAGESVHGTAAVEVDAIRLEVVLPWMLAILAGPIKEQIEQRGRLLLGHAT